jgi:hypothetical protein
MPFAKLNRDLFRAENRSILIDLLLLGTLGVSPAQLCLVLGVERTLASNGRACIGQSPPTSPSSWRLYAEVKHEVISRIEGAVSRRTLIGSTTSQCKACNDIGKFMGKGTLASSQGYSRVHHKQDYVRDAPGGTLPG